MEAYVGQINLFAYDKIPAGWLACNGQALPITQYAALYALLGSSFGQATSTQFYLPDLRGRTLVGSGTSAESGRNYPLGISAGVETVALTATTVPSHQHSIIADATNGSTPNPENNFWAQSILSATTGTAENLYGPAVSPVALNPAAVSTSGGSAAHANIQPYQPVCFAIATVGVFPPRD